MRRLATLSFSLLLFACGGGEEAEKQALAFPRAPIVLISIDTLRSDHLPAYGYKGVETPHLDALADDGVVFEQAWSHCPMTLPSHVSMLTGLLPTEHGVRNNAGFTWDTKVHESLPQILARNGYETGAAVSSYVLRGETGMRGAFAFYDDVSAPSADAAFAEYQRGGDVTSAVAEHWLDSVRAKPFFLFLHLYEPHVPYAPPEPFRSRYASAYDGEIAAADAIVGKFIDSLKKRGVYDNAIIVITSDHGEGLGDHGEQQHSILLYREAIQVPLIVKLPHSMRKGERIANPVGLFDIAPTLATLTGVTMKASPKSVNLFEAPASRNIYAETIYPYLQLGWSDLRTTVNERWQLIDGPKPELYDHVADTAERQNVLAENRRVASALIADARSYPPATNVQASIDSETASKLASLGYIGTVRERPDPRTLANPNEAISILGDLQQAFALANEKRHEDAIAALEQILRRFPKMQEVRVRLAESQAALGRNGDAIASYRAALAASDVLMPEVLLALGDLCVRAGKLDEAAQIAQAAHATNAAQAIALDARVALARGELQRAITRSEEAERVAMRPLFGMSMLRGEAFARMEKPRNAIDAYRSEISAFPSHAEAYARLAVVLFLTGDRAGFEATLDALARIDAAMAQRTRAAFAQ
ncbi:MAG TPA: sulfatase-like hydrolase/transferase [Thermoanaerobaculia bacterium]|nr:sulfatase-like hydrolase/transferase [Thermoanaerobaculia bacterium]